MQTVQSSPQPAAPKGKGDNFKKYVQKIIHSPKIIGLSLFVFLTIINSFTHNIAQILSGGMLFLIGLVRQISGFVIMVPIFQGPKGGLYFMSLILTFYVVASYWETLKQASASMLDVLQLKKLETDLTAAKLAPQHVDFVKGRRQTDGKCYNLTTFNMLKKISKSNIDPMKFLIQLFLAFVLASTSANFMEEYAPSGNPTQAATNLVQEVLTHGFKGGWCTFQDPKNTSSPVFCANEDDPKPIPFAQYKGPKFRTEPKLIIPFMVLWFLFSSTFWEGELLNVETPNRVDKPVRVKSSNHWVKKARATLPYLLSIGLGIFATENVVTSAESMITSKTTFVISAFLHIAFLSAWFWCGLMPHFIQEDLITNQQTLRDDLVAKLKKQVEATAKIYDTKKYVHSGGVSLGDWFNRNVRIRLARALDAISQEQYLAEVAKYEKAEKMHSIGNKSGQFYSFTAAEIRKMGSRFHQLAIEGDSKTIAKEAPEFESNAKAKSYESEAAKGSPNPAPAVAPAQATIPQKPISAATTQSPAIQGNGIPPNPIATSLNGHADGPRNRGGAG